jgi:hypothetical protein
MGAIVVRTGADSSQECPAHGVGIAEAASQRHLLNRDIRILQQAARGIEPGGFDVFVGVTPVSL